MKVSYQIFLSSISSILVFFSSFGIIIAQELQCDTSTFDPTINILKQDITNVEHTIEGLRNDIRTYVNVDPDSNLDYYLESLKRRVEESERSIEKLQRKISIAQNGWQHAAQETIQQLYNAYESADKHGDAQLQEIRDYHRVAYDYKYEASKYQNSTGEVINQEAYDRKMQGYYKYTALEEKHRKLQLEYYQQKSQYYEQYNTLRQEYYSVKQIGTDLERLNREIQYQQGRLDQFNKQLRQVQEFEEIQEIQAKSLELERQVNPIKRKLNEVNSRIYTFNNQKKKLEQEIHYFETEGWKTYNYTIFFNNMMRQKRELAYFQAMKDYYQELGTNQQELDYWTTKVQNQTNWFKWADQQLAQIIFNAKHNNEKHNNNVGNLASINRELSKLAHLKQEYENEISSRSVILEANRKRIQEYNSRPTIWEVGSTAPGEVKVRLSKTRTIIDRHGNDRQVPATFPNIRNLSQQISSIHRYMIRLQSNANQIRPRFDEFIGKMVGESGFYYIAKYQEQLPELQARLAEENEDVRITRDKIDFLKRTLPYLRGHNEKLAELNEELIGEEEKKALCHEKNDTINTFTRQSRVLN